jgi:hypothetical protein
MLVALDTLRYNFKYASSLFRTQSAPQRVFPRKKAL